MTSAQAARWSSTRSLNRSSVSSGVSPDSTMTSPPKPLRAARAEATASPVPSGRSCTATIAPSTSPSASAKSGDVTTTSGCGSSGCTAPVDEPTAQERMQVLAGHRAHTRAEASRHHDGGQRSRSLHARQGWGARIRTWGRGTKTRCLTTWLRPNGAILARASRLTSAPLFR